MKPVADPVADASPTARTVGSPAPAVLDDAGRPAGRTVRAALPATAVGLVAFLAIQGILAAYNVDVLRDAISRGLLNGYPSVFLSLPRRLLSSLIGGGISYLCFALVGTAIASRGRRVLFVLPAACFVLVTVFVSGYPHQPQAIGEQWQVECFSRSLTCAGPWFAHPWFGSLLDLALVLLPGLVVAVRVHARRATVDVPAIAVMLATIALLATAGWTIAVIEGSLDLRAFVAVGAMGIGLGTARPWWPWLHVLFAALVSGAFVWFWLSLVFPDPGYSTIDYLPYMAEVAWPMVVVGLLASGWQPLAWLLRRLDEQPFRLLVAVNLLNVVDAIMTAIAVGSGGALEANPVVRLAGLPAKVIVVGMITWLLYRRRPSALVWPAVALLWVVAYHVGGTLVNGWR